MKNSVLAPCSSYIPILSSLKYFCDNVVESVIFSLAVNPLSIFLYSRRAYMHQTSALSFTLNGVGNEQRYFAFGCSGSIYFLAILFKQSNKSNVGRVFNIGNASPMSAEFPDDSYSIHVTKEYGDLHILSDSPFSISLAI